MEISIRHILFLFIMASFGACAVETAPLGGPKDETPPVLDTLRSTTNYQLYFQKQDIVLYFNEWVTLRDAFNQVIVSPPLEHNPDISQKGKRVRFKFHEDEQLRDSVTYTINFGESIRDFTEGNPVKDLRFVFSTGDKIDSLELRGKVVDAGKKEPASEVFVLLYDDLSDSVVYKERPYYFSKTDKDGTFAFANLREDSFKVFVLGDQNLNFIYDQETEGTGFLTEPIYLNDTLPGYLNIEYFTPELELQYFDNVQDEYGLVKLAFNRSPYDLDYELPESGYPWEQKMKKDSMMLYYASELGKDTIFLNKKDGGLDTVKLKGHKKAPFLEQTKRTLSIEELGNRNRLSIYPSNTLNWTFNEPIIAFDTSFLSVSADSIAIRPEISIDSNNTFRLQLLFRNRKSDTLQFSILPGFVESYRGLTNDTMDFRYLMDPVEVYGSIYLVLDSLNAEMDYLVQIRKGNTVLQEDIVTNSSRTRLEYIGFKPAEYSVYMVEDANGNGRWDPGNYESKKFSELWIEKKLQALRANWELEADINWTVEIQKQNANPSEKGGRR